MPQSEIPLFVLGVILLVLVVLAALDGVLRVRRLVGQGRTVPSWIRVEYFVLGAVLVVGFALVGVTFFAH